MAVAKVFRTGRSQAIRLPNEFHVAADTVHLKRTSEGFLVITKDPWEIFFEGVDQLSDSLKAPSTTPRAGACPRPSSSPRSTALCSKPECILQFWQRGSWRLSQ